MLYHDRTNVLEGINVNSTDESKEYDICHCWYFLNRGFKFQSSLSNRCYHLLMMSMNVSDIAILNIVGADYRCIISGIRKSEIIKLIQNIDMTRKSRTL